MRRLRQPSRRDAGQARAWQLPCLCLAAALAAVYFLHAPPARQVFWLDASEAPPEHAGHEARDHMIQLAAVQSALDLADYRSEATFSRAVDRQVQAAVRGFDPGLPSMVAFPEDIGLPLVLLGEPVTRMPAVRLASAADRQGLASLMASYVRRHLAGVLPVRLRYRCSWARAIWISRQEKIARTYIETFAAAARRYGVYLVAGSAPLQVLPIEDGQVTAFRVDSPEVFNTSYVFDPNGRVLLAQRKVHLLPIEGRQGLDIEPGRAEDLRVVQTGLGRLGVAICFDVFHADVLQSLRWQDAQVLVQPSANPAAWDEAQQADWLNGAWRAVADQKMFEYAVNPMAVGSLYDLRFEGQSSIIGKNAATAGGYADIPARPGFLATAGRADRAQVLAVRVPQP